MEPRVLPAYGGGSLVNLVASLVEARGGPPRHPPLALLEPRELASARNIVLVIVDGLGDNYLMRQGKGGELARRRRGALTSVFPSTTASAITTSYTGCTPLEHGITGWYTYFGEAGYVAAPLPFRTRGDMLPLREKGFSPERAFTAKPIFESMQARAIIVSSAEIIGSDPTKGSNGAIEVAEALAARDPSLFMPYQYGNPANPAAHYNGPVPVATYTLTDGSGTDETRMSRLPCQVTALTTAPPRASCVRCRPCHAIRAPRPSARHESPRSRARPPRGAASSAEARSRTASR